MNRSFVLTLIGVITLLQYGGLLYAHPLDVSNTTLTLENNRALGVTYIHPVELDRILLMSGGLDPTSITVGTYYSLTGVLTEYLAQTIEIINDGSHCEIGHYEFQEGLMIDEIYSAGFPISYVFTCDTELQNLQIRITFMNEVPLQTNRLYIYRTRNGSLSRTDYKVLNAKKDSHTLSLLLDGQQVQLQDRDRDGLSDEDEILYSTNPDNADTDGDGYGDMIELQSSWNPVSRELSPGQIPFSSESTGYQANASGSVRVQSMSLIQDSQVWGGERFTKILRDIRIYVEGSTTSVTRFCLLILSVGILGFLHALGPGHSKGILISQIIDDSMSYGRSILYCGIFTIIHLIDIVVVVLLTKIFFSIIDPSVYLATLGKISALLVVAIGIYIFYITLRRLRKKRTKDVSVINMPSIDNKNYMLMAIITGLMPCAFGWSIFLMLLAIGRPGLALPLLGGLGIGIFFCLSGIATFTWFLRDKIYRFSPKISMISPMISSLCIISIGLGLIVNTF